MENNAVFHVPFFISPRRRDKTSDGRRRAQRPNFASCPCAPAPGGGRAKPPGSSGEGMVSSFLCPVPRPPPPEGAGAKPPGSSGEGMASSFLHPVPAPPPPEGAGAEAPGSKEKRMVSKLLCLFHSVATKWLPKTAGNHWGRRGGKNGNFCMATKWLPRELFREKRFPFFLFWGDFSTFSADARGVVPG